MAFPALAWRHPPPDLVLPGDEVHAWRAALDRPASQVQRLWSVLAEEERQRATRFYFAKDRRRFIVARGLLRAILGRYLDAPPALLRFGYSDYGKPALIAGPAQETLDFNVSHSGEVVLYGVTRGREVGIDVEQLRPIPDAERIAERFFSAQENAVLRSLPAERKQEAFFTCWTRKEAYIKARGEGLSLPLDQFDVSLEPGQAARLLSTRGDPQEASRWSLVALPLQPGYVGALAVRGRDWRLRCWQGVDWALSE